MVVKPTVGGIQVGMQTVWSCLLLTSQKLFSLLCGVLNTYGSMVMDIDVVFSKYCLSAGIDAVPICYIYQVHVCGINITTTSLVIYT